MQSPIIAIVGSADPTRTDYNPPLKQLQKIGPAAEELGRELARANYRIMVYSASPAFLEADVVRGYVSSNVARPEAIQIRYPRGTEGESRFAEQDTHPSLFDPRPDTQPNWEVSFYQSLKDAHGVLIIGGASSALITGLMARLLRLPLVVVSCFGGSAENVWTLMPDLAYVSPEEHRLMGRSTWEADSATPMVTALTKQRERIAAEAEHARLAVLRETGRVRKRAALAAGLFVLAVALMGTATFVPVGAGWFVMLFLATPLLAGAAGGISRNVVDLFQGTVIPAQHDELAALALGMIGGFISAMLFVLAQWMSMPEGLQAVLTGVVPGGMRTLVPFALIIAFTAGLTIELVFTKLRGTDVLNVGPISALPR